MERFTVAEDPTTKERGGTTATKYSDDFTDFSDFSSAVLYSPDFRLHRVRLNATSKGAGWIVKLQIN